MYTMQQYHESAQVLREKLEGFEPEFLMILGSGLAGLSKEMEVFKTVPYGEVPHMKRSTAPGHKGEFIAGVLGNKKVLMMQGRLHLYEGYEAEDVVYPVRLAYLLGARSMIVTNAAGVVNTSFEVGDPMVIEDFMKFPFPTPLRGPNLDEFGTRFPDMSEVFTKEYRELFLKVAEEEQERVQKGVYFYMPGPQFETPAEIRAIRTLGADATGMSTVFEAIAARHLGMKILGISLITNMAAGVLPIPLSGDDVNIAADKAAPRMKKLVRKFLERV